MLTLRCSISRKRTNYLTSYLLFKIILHDPNVIVVIFEHMADQCTISIGAEQYGRGGVCLCMFMCMCAETEEEGRSGRERKKEYIYVYIFFY